MAWEQKRKLSWLATEPQVNGGGGGDGGGGGGGGLARLSFVPHLRSPTASASISCVSSLVDERPSLSPS